MSAFSNLDASERVNALLDYLDDTDASMAALKAYMVAAAQRYRPDGVVLDVGCGVGHDLDRLSRAGIPAVGLDPSARALDRARRLHPVLVQADGARLPFRDHSLGGCRMERVLQHVLDPGAVLDEIIRVVKPNGFLALLDADQTSLRVKTETTVDPGILGQWSLSRQPTVAAEVPSLLRARGCAVDDVVTELSHGFALDRIPFDAEQVLDRAVARGFDPTLAADWLAEQQERTKAGTFEATWTKILVIARTPG